MKIKRFGLSVIAAVVLLGSCSTPKDVAYFQDVTQGGVYSPEKQLDVRVKPDDKLSIVVNTQDPALSQLFNLVQVSTRLGASSRTRSAETNTTMSNGQTSLYTVNKDGDIRFPVLGNIHIAGMRRWEVASYIERLLVERKLVQDPIVVVEFANTGITVMGEVRQPGRIEFNRDRVSIFDAVSFAGDLTENGRRDNILVIRELENGAKQTYRVNLLDLGEAMKSPVYWLEQNDVVYVEPTDKKKRESTVLGNQVYNPTFWTSIVATVLSLVTMTLTLSRR